MKKRFGIAGLSHFHAATILEAMQKRSDVQVLAISEEDGAIRKGFSEKYQVKAYEDALQMCDSERLDAVAVVERPDSRADLAARLVEMGLSVLLDKPAAVDLEGLNRLKDAAKKGPGSLFPYFTVRYERPVAKALELISRGAIGKVSSFTSLRPHKLLMGSRPGWFWGMRGGVIVDLGIHDIDIYRAVCGFRPEKSYATFGSQGNFSGAGGQKFPDSGQFMIRPDCGPSGTFLADWLTPSGDPRHGDCAYFIAGTQGRIEVRSTGGIQGDGESLVMTAGADTPRIVEGPPDDLRDIYTDFLNGEPAGGMIPGWTDMLIANGMAIKAEEAARTGETTAYEPC